MADLIAISPFLFALGAVIFFLWKVIVWMRQARQLHKAKSWPTTQATIRNADRQTVSSTKYGPIILPVCSFSYQVNGEEQWGLFSLLQSDDPGEPWLKSLINRTLTIHYDPAHPENSYIPTDNFAGNQLIQKMGPHLMQYYPGS